MRVVGLAQVAVDLKVVGEGIPLVGQLGGLREDRRYDLAEKASSSGIVSRCSGLGKNLSIIVAEARFPTSSSAVSLTGRRVATSYGTAKRAKRS
jgi:hypothetical protein